MLRRSRTVCCGAVPVGLVHHEDVGDLQDAGLGRLDASRPCPARRSTIVESAERGDLHLGLADPDGLDEDDVAARRVEDADAPAGAAQDSPPRWPRLAIERMNTPGSVAWSCIRTRSPSSAPPVNGDDGSTASTPTRSPALRNAVTSAPVDVDFPTPGEPVRPMTRARPA